MDCSELKKMIEVWNTTNKNMVRKKGKICLEIADQITLLFSYGPFYYYIFNYENMKMEYVSKGTREMLGIEPAEFTKQKECELMHPDDLARLSEKNLLARNFILNKIATKDRILYKVVYMFRLKHISGIYKTFLYQVKPLKLSDDGNFPLILFGTLSDVTHLNIPMNHDVSFISTERPSYYAVKTNSSLEFKELHLKEQFTNREREIIFYLSQGMSFIQIAQILFLSPHTITTHKKNILSKSGCRNTPELITKCIREGII